ncbi:hypothetical protein PsorP6_015818 [Peronosclerospora sorghi]|uniref:Uncharacterized protein n=1 Tax=Peronosclerospora sorghi TaxID=230839 RepID=A0ACC0WPS9_9STRA|nr:hypothetical protein PsorP6_015818 [Peronosclerospora sorghi]
MIASHLTISPMAENSTPARADLLHRESMLDNTSEKQRTTPTTPGKLEGWSPATRHELNVVPDMETLSLAPAPAAQANEMQGLSKAERKQRAAEAFAKAGGVPKRDKLSKAERRAQQEASREKKRETAPKAKKPDGSATSTPRNVRLQYDDAKKMARRAKAAVVVRTQAQKQVEMFAHLPQYERESSLSRNVGFSTKEDVHAAVLALGLKYAEGRIAGSNARCIAMMTALGQVIDEYVTPPDHQLRRDLDKRLRPLIQYLIDCRPHGVGMGNAIRSLRHVIASMPPDATDDDAKRQIRQAMDDYVQSRILLASQAVAKHATSKIRAGDVLLTYARSTVVEKLLLEVAHSQLAPTVRVIVVDSRPHYEGRNLVRVLATAGLACTYVHLHALSYIMRDVTLVLLGAAALMSNGVAIARVGTAVVAMTAHEANVPVLFCCETYKFSERVQLDAITHNELRDPDELVSSYCTDKPRARRRGPGTDKTCHILSDWRDLATLKLLNLVYDVTPSDYVSMVVTELGMIPPTSIPAVLREYSRENLVDGTLSS